MFRKRERDIFYISGTIVVQVNLEISTLVYPLVEYFQYRRPLKCILRFFLNKKIFKSHQRVPRQWPVRCIIVHHHTVHVALALFNKNTVRVQVLCTPPFLCYFISIGTIRGLMTHPLHKAPRYFCLNDIFASIEMKFENEKFFFKFCFLCLTMDTGLIGSFNWISGWHRGLFIFDHGGQHRSCTLFNVKCR